MARLLILSCSKSKRTASQPLPAIERYDGPAFRVLRRYLQSPAAAVLDTYILSAEFGLIPADHAIPHYDRRMTPSRARALQPCVMAALAAVAARHRYDTTFLYLGRDYRSALGEWSEAPLGPHVIVATGSPGSRIARLRTWLDGEMLPSNTTLPPVNTPTRMRLRGVERLLTTNEVLDVARHALRQELPHVAQPQSWYVVIDGTPVSPKWLVSLVFGLPVAAFHSQDARRILRQLGLETRLA